MPIQRRERSPYVPPDLHDWQIMGLRQLCMRDSEFADFIGRIAMAGNRRPGSSVSVATLATEISLSSTTVCQMLEKLEMTGIGKTFVRRPMLAEGQSQPDAFNWIGDFDEMFHRAFGDVANEKKIVRNVR